MYRRMRAYSEALENRLGQLAHITGGRLVLGRGRERVREAFDEVVKMLRSSYLVGYNAPPEAGSGGTAGLSWHRVDPHSKYKSPQLNALSAKTTRSPGWRRRIRVNR